MDRKKGISRCNDLRGNKLRQTDITQVHTEINQISRRTEVLFDWWTTVFSVTRKRSGLFQWALLLFILFIRVKRMYYSNPMTRCLRVKTHFFEIESDRRQNDKNCTVHVMSPPIKLPSRYLGPKLQPLGSADKQAHSCFSIRVYSHCKLLTSIKTRSELNFNLN